MHAVPLPITLLWFAHPLISISNPRCALAINSVVPLILFHEIFANHTWHFYYQHRWSRTTVFNSVTMSIALVLQFIIFINNQTSPFLVAAGTHNNPINYPKRQKKPTYLPLGGNLKKAPTVYANCHKVLLRVWQIPRINFWIHKGLHVRLLFHLTQLIFYLTWRVEKNEFKIPGKS